MPVEGKQYFFINSLAKGIKIIELLAEKQALTVTEAARHLGYNRAGSHRFLATLRELGYVEQDEEGRYHLTFRVVELGMKVVNRSEVHRIIRPYMLELSHAFNETVNLGHFDGKDVLHLDKIDSQEILRMDTPIGSRAPAYCTALGKAMLAFLPTSEREIYMGRTKLKPHGPGTITSRRQLRKALETIRSEGCATDIEELSSGLCCVAVPIFDHTDRPNYAISVSGPALRLTREKIATIRPMIKQVGRTLSQKLGSPTREIAG